MPYYESKDDFISTQQGRWSSVYQGGGGGCEEYAVAASSRTRPRRDRK